MAPLHEAVQPNRAIFEMRGFAMTQSHDTKPEIARAVEPKAARKTVTLVVPDGYATGEEFAKDCGFEIAKPAQPPWDAYYNRAYKPVETRAKEIYDAFEWYEHHGKKPEWVRGGNSTKQDEARGIARRELREAGHSDEQTDGERS
jgi:hypothetical protein